MSLARYSFIPVLLLPLMAVTLPACQRVPMAAIQAANRTLAFQLLPPQAARSLEALLTRHVKSEVASYKVTLLQWNGTSFQPTGITTTLVPPNQYAIVSFSHLAAIKYDVQVIGYNASNQAVTKTADASIDLSVNDVSTQQALTISMAMLDTSFSGTVVFPSNASIPTSVPSTVTGLRATLADASGTVLGEQSYAPSQEASATNLMAGTTYDLTLTATYSNGKQFASFLPFKFDAAQSSLDDTAVPFSVGAALASDTVGDTPTDVAVDASGTAWVLNQNSNSVTTLSSTGRVQGTFSLPASAFPQSIAFDGAGNAWITDTSSVALTELSPTGGTIGTYTLSASPWGVALDSGGNAWTTEPSGAVEEVNSSGAVVGSYTIGGNPEGIAIDNSDNVWVANNASNNVTELSSAGAVLGTVAVGTSPIGLAIDGSGNVWVANSGSNDVTELSSARVVMNTYPVGTSPQSLTIDGNGNVWVANNGSNDVTELSSSGSPLGTYSLGAAPRAIATGSGGNIWVTNGSNSVTELFNL